MALTYTDLTSITQRKFVPKLVDNIFDSNPLLQRAKSKFYERLDGGLSIMQPLAYATTSASGWFSGSDTLSNADNAQITSAEYAWKQLYASILISRDDELKNSGDSQILSLVANKVKIAEKTMADTVGDGLYSDGSDADAIQGLRDIVAADQTVGGIAQSTNSWWQAQVDSSTTTLTMSALQSLWTSASIDNDSPTVITATRANYDRYYNLLQPQQRFMDMETAKGGFSSLMFNGAPFIADSKVPSNHIFLLNENYLHFWVHKDEEFRLEPFQKPTNQAVKVSKVFLMCSFGSSNNRLHGKLSAITA